MYGHVNMARLSCLLKFCITPFISLLHDFMNEHGSNYCCGILEIISAKTNKIMIFDMSMKRKLLETWAEDLSDSGEEPWAAIRELFRSAGFSLVDLIGHFSTRRDRATRPVVRALL